MISLGVPSLGFNLPGIGAGQSTSCAIAPSLALNSIYACTGVLNRLTCRRYRCRCHSIFLRRRCACWKFVCKLAIYGNARNPQPCGPGFWCGVCRLRRSCNVGFWLLSLEDQAMSIGLQKGSSEGRSTSTRYHTSRGLCRGRSTRPDQYS